MQSGRVGIRLYIKWIGHGTSNVRWMVVALAYWYFVPLWYVGFSTMMGLDRAQGSAGSDRINAYPLLINYMHLGTYSMYEI